MGLGNTGFLEILRFQQQLSRKYWESHTACHITQSIKSIEMNRTESNHSSAESSHIESELNWSALNHCMFNCIYGFVHYIYIFRKGTFTPLLSSNHMTWQACCFLLLVSNDSKCASCILVEILSHRLKVAQRSTSRLHIRNLRIFNLNATLVPVIQRLLYIKLRNFSTCCSRVLHLLSSS